MAASNLVQLIREVKPQTVLFTTYTLSLSFFEAVLLPVLRQVGCRSISILVDANEAVVSLAEAHVKYAGRRYWLAPVVAPGGGVFHPKVSYLNGADVDVLAIGSGNLTLPGQSGQLETLDVVSSGTSPEVFRQFETFSTRLADKIVETSTQAAGLLREYALQSERVAGASNAESLRFPDVPSLISTVEHPASAQIAALSEEAGLTLSSLTVLSPFHSPDAAPIERLSRAVGIDSISIGLDPKKKHVAPFDLARLKIAKQAQYVLPVTEGRIRPLHGKVFELRGRNGVLIVTGSINATQQSLESMKNIEVSLVRRLSEPCFEWVEIEPVSFEPNKYVFEAQSLDFAYLDATLDSNGMIRGRLFDVNSSVSVVTAKIMRADVAIEGQTREIEVDAEGRFFFGPVGEIASERAVQLELTAEALRATCWLNVAEELAISDDERKERKSVRHILRGEFQEEDVAALLHLLLRATNLRGTVAPPNPRPTTNPKDVGPKDVVDRPFSFLQWEMSGHVGHSRGGVSVRYDDALSAFVRWLNGGAKTSRGAGGEPTGSTPHKPGLRDVKEEESEKKHGERDDINNSLQTLIQAIPRLFAENPKVDYADVLASVVAAHALRLSLTSMVSDAQRLLPVINWLDAFSRFEYRDTVRESLQPTAVGIAMVAAAVSRLRDVAVPGSVLKESLLRFGCDGLSTAELEQLVSQALKSEIFARVDQAALSLAPQMCGEVWSAESLDDRILRMVKLSRLPGAKVPKEDEEMFPGVFAGLRNHVPRPGKVFRDGVISTSDALKAMHGCPHCYLQLEESIRRALRSKHMVACNRENCHKVIFFLEAPDIADSVKKALRDV